jgi:hypothetical protein
MSAKSVKKLITAEIVNPEAIEYASEEFTKLLFEFYMDELNKKQVAAKEEKQP